MERQRIARELHDELGQHITALRVGLQAEAQAETLSRLKAIVDRLDETIDRLTLELRPPALDQLGLHEAITALTEEFAEASGLRVDLHAPGIRGLRVADAIATTMYRILQEALTNVWKHARASTVSVIVDREGDSLRMIVEDDGHGFDVDSMLQSAGATGRFGLVGMRERLALVGGSLLIESDPEGSTTLFARVPASEPAAS